MGFVIARAFARSLLYPSYEVVRVEKGEAVSPISRQAIGPDKRASSQKTCEHGNLPDPARCGFRIG